MREYEKPQLITDGEGPHPDQRAALAAPGVVYYIFIAVSAVGAINVAAGINVVTVGTLVSRTEE